MCKIKLNHYSKHDKSNNVHWNNEYGTQACDKPTVPRWQNIRDWAHRKANFLSLQTWWDGYSGDRVTNISYVVERVVTEVMSAFLFTIRCHSHWTWNKTSCYQNFLTLYHAKKGEEWGYKWLTIGVRMIASKHFNFVYD